MNKVKTKIKKSAIETEPGTRKINIIHCDQSVGDIMLQLIKMNKNMYNQNAYQKSKQINWC